jgi:hypothetical protein
MGQLGRRRPSAALVVAIIALVLAASGTAVATSRLVNGDSLIRKHSLSGDRLRNQTITARQIKLSSLRSALLPISSGVGGAPGTVGSGLITAAGGHTVKLASFGPFTVSLQCNDNGDGTFDSTIQVTSTAASSEVSGTALTAGTPQEIDDAGPDSGFDDNGGGTLADFVAPPQAYMGYMIDAVFMPGTSTPCAASLLVGQS